MINQEVIYLSRYEFIKKFEIWYRKQELKTFPRYFMYRLKRNLKKLKLKHALLGRVFLYKYLFAIL